MTHGTSVVLIFSCFIFQYADSTCTKNKFGILCRLPHVTESTTIYRIQLSIQKKAIERIVAINLVPPNRALPTWNNQEIKERTSIEGSKLFPVNEAQLLVTFNRLECYDSGIYWCNISGVDSSGEFHRYIYFDTKNFTGCHCDDNEVTTAIDGNIKSSEPPLTSENTIYSTITKPSYDTQVTLAITNGNIQSSEPPLTSENTIHSTTTNPSYSQQFSDISSSTTTTRMHRSSLSLTTVNSDNVQDSLVGNRSTNMRQTAEVHNFFFIICVGIITNIDS